MGRQKDPPEVSQPSSAPQNGAAQLFMLSSQAAVGRAGQVKFIRSCVNHGAIFKQGEIHENLCGAEVRYKFLMGRKKDG